MARVGMAEDMGQLSRRVESTALISVHGQRVVDLSPMHSPTSDALSLFPASTCSEAQESDRVRVVVRAGLALLKELGDLIQGEEGQFDLIGLDLSDVGQWVFCAP